MSSKSVNDRLAKVLKRKRKRIHDLTSKRKVMSILQGYLQEDRHE